MAPTSDERREVAARLRGFADTDVWLSAMFAELEKFGDTDRPRADAIADLIDPTCRAVHQGTSMDDELVCSECGASLGVEVDDEQRFIPKYCSCCGARVVSGDD